MRCRDTPSEGKGVVLQVFLEGRSQAAGKSPGRRACRWSEPKGLMGGGGRRRRREKNRKMKGED